MDLAVTVAVGVLSAVIGALVTKWLTPDYSRLQQELVESQRRIEALEHERSQWDAVQRFRPTLKVLGELPTGQSLQLTAEKAFTLARVDYIGDTSVVVGYEEPNQQGKQVVVPIDNNKILRIRNSKVRQGDHPIPIKFRCELLVDGRPKTQEFDAVIQPEIKLIEGTHTYCQTVKDAL